MTAGRRAGSGEVPGGPAGLGGGGRHALGGAAQAVASPGGPAAAPDPPEAGAGPGATPALSVVVPAWNEAALIADCLDALTVRLRGLDAEVIVVDDGSTDGTERVVGQWRARHAGEPVRLVRRPHAGKGAAVYAGALESRGRAVAYIDADLEVPARAVAALWEARRRRGWDVVVGCRSARSRAVARRPWPRVAVSFVFAWVARCLFRLPVHDTQTGVKLFDGPWLRRVAERGRVRGFLFDVELLVAATREGLSVGEVEVEVRRRRPLNRIGVADVARALWELPTVARAAAAQVAGSDWRRVGRAVARVRAAPRATDVHGRS